MAAAVSDPGQSTRKLVIANTRLVPRMAALDPSLMVGLPPDITAATGMDAITHAIGAFIGHWGTAFTGRQLCRASLHPRQCGLCARRCPPVGGLYHTPHGLANAIMLAHVLRFLSPAIVSKLAVLALHEDDIPALARAACGETNANYPVPMYLSQADCEAVLRQALPSGKKTTPKRRK